MSRRLDRHRPLWEMYFIEGLEDGRFAILSKSHQILVDGVATIDLGQVLLDVDPRPARARARRLAAAARAERRRRWSRSAVRDSVRDPRQALDTRPRQRRQRGAHRRRGRRPASARGRRRAVQPARRPAESPISATLSEQRRFVDRDAPRSRTTARSARVHGGTVNDVILATVTGAMRNWLMTRAESVHGSRVAARDGADERASTASSSRPRWAARSPATFVDLPIGESEPGGPAAPGLLRAQGAQGDRPRGRRRPARGHRRLRADHVPRARLAGRGRAAARAASTW